ncbi:hypothetical protein ACFQY5_02110 [Paeniroseomonas aquatica]|uniref:hypothetical protein n=1 Tax=Paeniroseomonas aquatica TaxID=373043 RepID=UPI00360C7F0C
MTPEVLAALEAAKAAKRPVALLTRLTDGAQHLFPGAGLPAPLAEAAAKALREDAAANVTADGAPGSSIRTTRRCASSWSARCISPRRWCRWRRRSASR